MTDRPPVDGFATCRRCGADLAEDAAFCAECGAPAPATANATTARGERSAGRPWWIPAAIVVGGIAAIGGGALLAVALGDRGVAADPSATAGVSVAAGATAMPSMEASIEPSPASSPTPALAPVIENRAIVEVGADPLNLRQQPNEDASILAELPPGRRLFVIGDPTDAGDLRWYRVGVVSGPDCPEDCNLIGHVATPTAADEEPWIAEVTIDCPASPMTHGDLSALLPLEALHCYGRADITLTGTVDTPCCSPPNPIRVTPDWLAGPAPAFLRQEGSSTFVIVFRADPAAGLDVPERGDVVRVIGHFEDPAATSCRAEVDEDFFEGQPSPEPVELPDPARVILDCRATFVWTGYEVTGFEDLGPCCGGAPWSGSTGRIERGF